MFDRLKAVPLWIAVTLPAYAQQQPADQGPATGAPQPPAGADEMTGELMFFTLGAGLLIAILMMVFFLRNRSNRAAADRVFNPKDRDRPM